MKTDTPVIDVINEQRTRIMQALGQMPYGGGCNFRFADPTKETEVQFLTRTADNLVKLVQALVTQADTTHKNEFALRTLEGQRRAVREFLGLDKLES